MGMDSDIASWGQGYLVAFDDVLAGNTAATTIVADTCAVMVQRTRLVDLHTDAP